jgi:ABC-type sugar transport system substrate-binding protein
MKRRFGSVAIVVAATVATAGLLASSSSGAPKAQRTIGLVDYSGSAGYLENGSQAAANALGDRLAITETSDAATQTSAIESLIAQHVAAIAVDDGQTDSGVNQALAQARKAGIATLSFDGRYSNAVWVNPSSPAEYAHALADSLALQMQRRGQYVIVPCRPANPIVGTYLKLIERYLQQRYPRMHRIGVVYGADGNGPAGSLLLRPLLRKQPNLRGLIFLCQDEAYNGPPQLIHLHKAGKIFSAGNGSFYAPPVVEPWRTSVRRGVEEIVVPSDPAKLGYLAVWAADHLAAGDKFIPGSYVVGGPVGTVNFYLHNSELRLGQPLTITKANLQQYEAQS